MSGVGHKRGCDRRTLKVCFATAGIKRINAESGTNAVLDGQSATVGVQKTTILEAIHLALTGLSSGKVTQ
jgi:hypothetical protein